MKEYRNNIENVWKFLRATKEDAILVRTSRVGEGWHDVEFDAHAAGFEVYRVIDPEMKARHEFAECYKFIRV